MGSCAMWSRALNGTAMVQERTNSSKVFYFWGHCQNKWTTRSPIAVGLGFLRFIDFSSLCFGFPYAPCMVYLPIFGWFLGQMLVKNPAPWSIWVNRTRRISSWRFAMDSSKSGGWTLGSKKWAGNKGHELTLFRKKKLLQTEDICVCV